MLASSSGSTPPTPASSTRRRGSGRRPSTSPRSSPTSVSTTSGSSRARRGATTSSAASPGADPGRGALLVHGHLDVVPADASEWSVHPFSGRGAGRLRVGPRRGRHEGHGRDDARGRSAPSSATACVPPRDIVFAFVADEEAGGAYGAQWLVENRPDLFDGVHRGGRRGRRLLADAERGPARLPDPVRREGHRLDAAAGPRQARPRLVPPRRQRRDEGGRGRGPARQPHVPAHPHRHRPHLPRPHARAHRAGVPRGRPRGLDRQARPDRRGSSAPPSATPPTRPCSRRATRPTSSRRSRRPSSTAGCCPGGRRRSCARSTSCSART